MAKKRIIGEDGKEYYVKEKKPIYKRVWFIAIMVIVVLGVIGSMLGDDANNVATTNVSNTSNDVSTQTENVEPVQDYEITELQEITDDFLYAVSGILKNNTDRDKSYVQIKIPVYDSDGNKLGDCLDNINDLKAGQTWKFKASYLGESVEGMKANLDELNIDGF